MVLKGKDIFTADEFLDLVEAVGWGKKSNFDQSKITSSMQYAAQMYAIRNSTGKLVALARVFSDNYLFSTIPEILVDPQSQKMGMGKAIMEEIKKDFCHTVMYFGAQPGNENFFEKLGFKKGMQSYTLKKNS